MPEPHPITAVDDYGDQVREVLQTPPTWLTRTGSVLVLFFLLTVFALAYWVRYPDVLRAEVVITSVHPPVGVVAKAEGKLAHLLVEEAATVEKGQLLAVMETPADYRAVARLKAQLQGWAPLTAQTGALDFPQGFTLGSLQGAYATLIYDYDLWRNFGATNARDQQLALLEQQREAYQELLTRQNSHQKHLAAEHDLTKAALQRAAQLLADGTVALIDYEASQKEELRARKALDANAVEQSQTQVTITGLDRQMLALRSNVSQRDSELSLQLTADYQRLLQAIEAWEEQYLLRAPIAGKLSYFSFWSPLQDVVLGEEVFTIVPATPADYFGKANLPVRNTGKLAVGQRAQVKLANYPFEEFGMLVGEVAQVSALPKQGFYQVDVAFAQPLVTSQGTPLALKDEVVGELEIVTEDLRLLERVFYELRGAFE